eukprot:6195380-Pleurochrysis_carterae.AAC.2
MRASTGHCLLRSGMLSSSTRRCFKSSSDSGPCTARTHPDGSRSRKAGKHACIRSHIAHACIRANAHSYTLIFDAHTRKYARAHSLALSEGNARVHACRHAQELEGQRSRAKDAS